MNSKERREILLRKYIEEVKQFPNVFPNGYEDEGKGTFICPLCLRILNIALLGEQVNNFITIEHIPPENLGGKPLILTCKDCNSTCGHDLDVYLRNEIEHLEHNYFNGAKGHYSKWFSREGFEMNGIIREDVDGTIDIEIKNKLNSPIFFIICLAIKRGSYLVHTLINVRFVCPTDSVNLFPSDAFPGFYKNLCGS